MAKVDLIPTDQDREDLIVTALEGGSNHWYFISDATNRILDEVCKDHKEPYAVRFWKAIKAGKKLPVHDVEGEIGDDPVGEISLESIEQGEQIMADQHKPDFMKIIMGEGDAETADIWFQLAVLKEVTYG